ncbi:MAG TPA: glycosyl hydrolase [Solirubrobacteraceae bacterium]|nr:glycosyl hydrolase [Solirubrobacteraceae bacterium]
MRRLLLALTLALAALAAAAAPSQALVVGIADQKPDMFADDRFDMLGVEHARLTVSWDAMTRAWETAEIDAWMAAARKNGITPLVSFGHSRANRRALPTAAGFRRAFLQFKRRYPWVREYATWNEANHCGQPTCHKEKLVAQYYRELRLNCKRCKVLAAELLDMPNMLAWVKTFRKYSKVEPKYWGLHNYIEANRFKDVALKKLLRRVKGEVWLTEVGGLVKRRLKKKYTVKAIPESESHARRVTTYLFDELLPVSKRIKRVYVYHWNTSTPTDSWDSALIGPDDRARPAFWVLYRAMRALRR